ncbi:zona pellucida-binding protein 2-like [Varanus komodoensis]|uniref:zona pellucida-binding protein 2-like n=1 Tax=Varanus komodoensis TaxID=61221 RepID=UPI001CF7C8B5|nr:zona pellucida-binding protein 2-like [Varanus komodoensis]
MSYQDAVGVVLGVLVVLLCDGLVCELLPELYVSDNGTSGLAGIAETSPDEDMEPIFVHVGAQKVTVPCKPAKMDFVIGVNPTYSWTREDGETSSVSGDAFLTLPKFHADDSGHYACTVSFQKEGQTYTKNFYHTVVGYHIRGELQVLLIFQTSSCDKSLTSGFMKTLYEHLSQVVAHLHCELLPGNSTCFPTLEKPLDEFNLQVELKVSPFGKDWDESCSSKMDALSLGCYRSAVQTNLQQAKEAITKFMEKNKRFPLGESVAPQDTFVNTFFSFLEGGKCQRGYGQTQELQAHCPDCCSEWSSLVPSWNIQ